MLGFGISVLQAVLAGLVKDFISKWLGQLLKKHRKVSKRKKRKKSRK